MSARHVRIQFVPLLLTALVPFSSCSSSSPTAPARIDLPANMVLHATADGVTDGLSISCTIDFVAQLQTMGNEARGTMGGEIVRKALFPDQSGIAFNGDAYYPDIRISVDRRGTATLRSYKDGVPWPPSGTSRFWDEVLSFTGVYHPESNSLSGTWTCRPIDTRSDDKGDVKGSWTLRARN